MFRLSNLFEILRPYFQKRNTLAYLFTENSIDSYQDLPYNKTLFGVILLLQNLMDLRNNYSKSRQKSFIRLMQF
jgi:hypothetical protein